MKTRITRQLVAAVAAVALWFSAAGLSAAPSLVCDGQGSTARCVLEIDGGIAFEAAVGAIEETSAPGYRLTGDVVLMTPAQDFHLADADIVLNRIDAFPGVEIFGYARAPIGNLPILGEASIDVAPIVAMGVITRTNLEELFEGEDLPLAKTPGREATYFFFHFDTGLELDLGLAELLGLNTSEGASDPFQYDFPGDTSLTMLLDVQDPYFYLSSEARAAVQKKIEKLVNRAKLGYEIEKERRAQEAKKDENDLIDDSNGDDGNDDGSSGNDDGDQDKKKNKKDKKAKKNKKDKKSKKSKKSKKDKGSGGMSLGSVAFSWNGGIEYAPETTWGLPEGAGVFDGHIFVETTIPLGYGIEVSGPVVAYLGNEGVRIGANGDVTIGKSFPIVGIEIELGSASAGQMFTRDGYVSFFSGVLDPDTSFLPEATPIHPQAALRVASYLNTARLDQTRLLAQGEFDIGLDQLGKMTGLKLDKALEMNGEITVDRDGIHVIGTTTSRIHKDIAFAGEAEVEAYFNPVKPEDFVLIMRGDLMVGGVNLSAGAELDLSARGLFIDGFFMTPITDIGLHGELTKNGPVLEGFASVDMGLDGISNAMDKAYKDLEKAEAKVRQLDVELARVRAIVQVERDRDAAKINEARGKVSAAQREVDSINGKISAANSRISQLKKEIKDWKSWYNRQPWYKKTTAWAKYLAEKAKRDAQIAAKYAEIGALKTALVAAKGVLSAAQAALKVVEKSIQILPVDVDPRVAPVLAARGVALGVLEAAQKVVGGFPQVGGEFTAEINVRLDRKGLRGEVHAVYNGVELADGRVRFGSDPTACVKVAQLGEVCAPF